MGFAVRYVTSQVHGARPEASKAVVILVMGTSTDSVAAAATAARSNRKCRGAALRPQTASGFRVGGGYFPTSWLILNT